MTAPLIRLENVSFSYREKTVIDEIDCAVHEGEFVGIIGPNGAGKTTLLRLISGYLKPRSGRVFLRDVELHRYSPHEIARTLAFVPQTETPAFPFDVFSLVMLGRHPHLAGMGFESPEDARIVSSALELTGIDHLAGRNVMELSGGEFHRVTIARALAQNTPFLLLDEPTAHLDVQYQGAMFDLFAHLVKHRRRTLVCVTHELNLAAAYCDRVFLLHEGRVVADDAPEAVISERRIHEFFGPQLAITEIDGRRISYPLPGDQSFDRFHQSLPNPADFRDRRP